MYVEVRTIDGKSYRFEDVHGIETNETSIKIVLYIKNGVEKAYTFMRSPNKGSSSFYISAKER